MHMRRRRIPACVSSKVMLFDCILRVWVYTRGWVGVRGCL
jgi:hypothetical protein